MATRHDNKLVSVVIPVYNSEKHITKTLDSVINQTYKYIEILLVDDCSTDNSEQIINEYSKNKNSISYYRLERNSGAAVARNKALELAKGRYIAFLDSDDLWYPQKIEEQLELMEENNSDFCFTAIEMIDEDGLLIKEKRNVREQVNYRLLLKNTMIATSSVVIDRNKVGIFKMPLLRSGQDYATWLQLLRGGTMACGINKALVKYRISNNSLSSNKWKSIQQVWGIQINQEKINPVAATVNTVCFIINALKKHYL